MKKEIWKGGALLAPLPPALVTCGTMDKPNILTIGWTGITNTIPPKTYISVRPSRYSYNIIKETKEFVINLTTKELVRAADYCGVKTGAKNDKFKDMHLTPAEASQVMCPVLDESPVNIECKVTDIIPLGSHDMFLADIVAVNIASDFIDDKGKLHLSKCNLVAYAHGEYFALGERLGTFGYSVRKKPKKRKNNIKRQNPPIK